MNSLKTTNYLLLAVAVLLGGNLLLASVPQANASNAPKSTQLVACMKSTYDKCVDKPVVVDKDGRLRVVVEK